MATSAATKPPSVICDSSRKRPFPGNMRLSMEDESQEQAGMADEDALDKDGFTEVLTRRNHRRLLKVSVRTCWTVTTLSRTSGMAVLFVPVSSSGSVRKLSERKLFLFLEAVVAGLIKKRV